MQTNVTTTAAKLLSQYEGIPGHDITNVAVRRAVRAARRARKRLAAKPFNERQATLASLKIKIEAEAAPASQPAKPAPAKAASKPSKTKVSRKVKRASKVLAQGGGAAPTDKLVEAFKAGGGEVSRLPKGARAIPTDEMRERERGNIARDASPEAVEEAMEVVRKLVDA